MWKSLKWPRWLKHDCWTLRYIFYTLGKGELMAFYPRSPRNTCKFGVFWVWHHGSILEGNPNKKAEALKELVWSLVEVCGAAGHTSASWTVPASTTDHHLPLASPPQGKRLVWRWGISPGLKFRVQHSVCRLAPAPPLKRPFHGASQLNETKSLEAEWKPNLLVYDDLHSRAFQV